MTEFLETTTVNDKKLIVLQHERKKAVKNIPLTQQNSQLLNFVSKAVPTENRQNFKLCCSK